MVKGILLGLFIVIQNFDMPWEPQPKCERASPEKSPIQQFRPLLFLPLASIKAYQFIFSAPQGDVCNFTPSCSHFSQECIKKYGLQGFFMTFDRLERCNFFSWHYLNKFYSLKEIQYRGLKLYDPPEQNVIWGKNNDENLYIHRTHGD
ncbi:MAG: membrane protein insertion efficiency factor YidD [Candidatus Edwardsbacteria bacterium]